MSVNITIDDNVLDTIKNAIEDKMSSISSCIRICDVSNERMENEYNALDNALNIIFKAKESANRAKDMAMSKS
jgi:hypothetical protein